MTRDQNFTAPGIAIDQTVLASCMARDQNVLAPSTARDLQVWQEIKMFYFLVWLEIKMFFSRYGRDQHFLSPGIVKSHNMLNQSQMVHGGRIPHEQSVIDFLYF